MPLDAAALTLNRETFAATIEEAKPLLLAHWREIARNQDLIPLDPDYERYAALEKADKLRVYVLRRGGEIVGYAVYLVDFHLHYKTAKFALADIFWTAPSVRLSGAIIGLLRFVEQQLRRDGVAVMHTTYKIAHPGAGFVLGKMGHTLIEHGMAKVLVAHGD